MWSTTSQPSFTTSGANILTYSWDSSSSTSTQLVYTTSNGNGLVFTPPSSGSGVDINCNASGFVHPDDPDSMSLNGQQSGSKSTLSNVTNKMMTMQMT